MLSASKTFNAASFARKRSPSECANVFIFLDTFRYLGNEVYQTARDNSKSNQKLVHSNSFCNATSSLSLCRSTINPFPRPILAVFLLSSSLEYFHEFSSIFFYDVSESS